MSMYVRKHGLPVTLIILTALAASAFPQVSAEKEAWEQVVDDS